MIEMLSSTIFRCNKMILLGSGKNLSFIRPIRKNKPTPTMKYYGTKTYDGDGKTTITILNEEIEFGLMINKYSNFGFKLNIGLNVTGPVALFPKSFFCWNVADPEQISPDSLILFLLLNPKPDILVLGTGIKAVKLNTEAAQILRSNRIPYEVLPTEKACSAFNFLSSERRMVAAGLIPPSNVPLETMQFKKLKERNAILKDDSI